MNNIPDKVKEAIAAVVQYNWEDELEDAKNQLRENGNIDGHIFRHLVMVDNFANGMNTPPEQYLRD